MKSGYIFIGLALAVVVVFFPILHASFVYDDYLFVVENPLVTREAVSMGEIFHQPFPWQEKSFEWYRPLTILGYRLNTAGGVPNGPAFHAVNLVLHLAVVMLFFVWARRFLDSLSSAAFAAFLFALMPGHAEAVLWVSGRSELIVTCLCLAAFLLIRHDRDHFRVRDIALLSLLFSVGLLVKESMVLLLPLVIALYVGSEKEGIKSGEGWRRALITTIPLVILFFGYLALRLSVVGSLIPAESETAGTTLLQRLPLSGKVFWQAFSCLIYLPAPSVEYFWTDALGFTWRSLAGWLVVVAAVVGWFRTRSIAVRHGIAIAVGGFILYSHLLASTELFAERFLYLSSMGFCLLAGEAHQRLKEKIGSRWVTILAVTWCLAVGLKTFSYAKVWRNDLTLWSYTVNVVPESPQALKNYGVALMKNGHVHSALNAFRKLRHYPGQELQGQILMLRAYGRMGRYKEGVALASAALLNYPLHGELLFLLGRHQFQLGDRSAAAETLDQLQNLITHDPEAAKFAHRLRYELNTGHPWTKSKDTR